MGPGHSGAYLYDCAKPAGVAHILQPHGAVTLPLPVMRVGRVAPHLRVCALQAGFVLCYTRLQHPENQNLTRLDYNPQTRSLIMRHYRIIRRDAWAPADCLLLVRDSRLSEGPVGLLQAERDGSLKVIFIISSQINHIWNTRQTSMLVSFICPKRHIYTTAEL